MPTLRYKHKPVELLCITLLRVPFSSIGIDRHLSQWRCPAPDGAARGVTPHRGQAVPVASRDLVGISDLSFAPSSSLSVEPLWSLDLSVAMTLLR